MDQQVVAVGTRIRERMPNSMSQRSLADAIPMTPDALSRAMSGKRGFSLSEITRIAEVIDSDLTWLLTGVVSSHRVEFAARHAWDPVERERANPGEAGDAPILEYVAELYRQAFPGIVPGSSELPASPVDIRSEFGQDFPRHFAEEVEVVFGIDVVRVPHLSTAYSMRIGARGIIVLNAIPNWFRSNWSLAHELAHLALGHHDDAGQSRRRNENAADKFASELLLPDGLMKTHDWSTMGVDELGRLLWEWGVSTRALANRLSFLRITPSTDVAQALGISTLRILNGLADRLNPALANPRAVAERQQRAASRRFPLAFVEALTRRTEGGEADPGGLAYVLDLNVDEVLDSFSVPEPESDDEIAERLNNDQFRSLRGADAEAPNERE